MNFYLHINSVKTGRTNVSGCRDGCTLIFDRISVSVSAPKE